MAASNESSGLRRSDAAATNAPQEGAASAPSAEPAAPPARSKSRKYIAIVAVVLVAIAGGIYWWVHRFEESTDDAQIDADVTSVPARTSGIVTAIHFTENQTVKAGDLLVELDPAPLSTRLKQAEADLKAMEAQAAAADADARVTTVTAHTNHRAARAQVTGANSSVTGNREQIAEAQASVASAKATLERANADLARGQRLFASQAIARQELEHYQTTATTAQANVTEAIAHLDAVRASSEEVQSQVAVASARLAQASEVDVLIEQARARADAAHAQADTMRAARDTAALELSYTKIYAPVDGAVSKKTVNIGQLAATGQAVVQLVPTTARWVTANFKETQLERMKPGQPVDIDVDVYSGVSVHGEVESISNATGARFALLPPDNATGNYTKIVQRVPVRIRIKNAPQGVTLRPGLSTVVTVDTER